MRLPAGQVLVYRDHRSPGVYVLLSGRIVADAPNPGGARGQRRLEASPGRPILLPRPEALDEPFGETWTVAERADALFLPRSLVHDSPDLRERLREISPR
jgi:hypothetical protein